MRMSARSLCIAVVLSCGGILFGCAADGPVTLTERARQIHAAGIVVDGHNDLPWQVREKADSSFDDLDLSRRQDSVQTDIPRLRAGGVDAQFWVVYVPAETDGTGLAAAQAREQFALIHEMIARHPDDLELARTAADIERIVGGGRIASLIGVEGGHMIEQDLSLLAEFHARGARYLGLTHSATIDWADSATDEPRSGGLSPFGEDVVRELNRLGMLVDLAHVSPDTMRDVLRVTTAPVISSHSGAYAVAPHSRNIPDDVLRGIRDNGGLVMVVFFSGYVDPQAARIMARNLETRRELRQQYPDEADYQEAWRRYRDARPIPAGTVRSLVDHIDHIVSVAGIDHVGLGSDYDGAGLFPRQLEDVSGFPYITQELLNRGYGEADIHKILGGNLLRVMREAEQVAAQAAIDG